MELFSLSSILPLATPFIVFSLRAFHRRMSNDCSGKKLPPGSTDLPYIGESLEFLRTRQKGHPEKFIYGRMAKFLSEVFDTSFQGELTVFFCEASANEFLFSNENKLFTAWFPNSVNKIFLSSQQSSSQEEAIEMRKLLPQFLKPEQLQRFISSMDVIAQRHLALHWDNKKEVAVLPLAKMYTFWLACRVFLSMEEPEHVKKFFSLYNALASGILSIPIDFPGTPFNRGIKASNMVRKELLKIIKQRKIDLAENKASPTHDILSHILTKADDNGQFMNEMDIADKILGLLIGGHDTASAAITFVIKYLAELPEVYNKVFEEQMEIANSKSPGELLNWEDIKKMRYSWNVVCEVMRLGPPLQGAYREAMSDFTFAGFSIPKGRKLYWCVNSTHRNPKCFPKPEKFDSSRFEGSGPAPYTFVPFGEGTTICPGKESTRLEILVFMHHVVKKFKWEKLLPNEKIIVDPMPIPAKGLPVHLDPHMV